MPFGVFTRSMKALWKLCTGKRACKSHSEMHKYCVLVEF